MKRKHFIYFCAFLVTAAMFMGCVTYSGRVAVKGNEPHTYIVIVTDDSEYVIVGDLSKKIRQEYQNKKITVKGKIVKKAEPGLPAELEVLEIIKVENM